MYIQYGKQSHDKRETVQHKETIRIYQIIWMQISNYKI